jgi:hypothetical protein
MSRKLLTAIVGFVAACACAAILTATGTIGSHPTTCQATQPVYTNDHPTVVGTWEVTLTHGQTVQLPDGDYATCTTGGLDVR